MKLKAQEAEVPAALAANLPGARLFRLGNCGVIVSRDEIPELNIYPRWHLSISHPARYPTWEEIGAARDQLLPPDVCMCIPFPPRAWWMSIHPNCFHLWEIRDAPLVECWRLDGEQAKAIGYGRPQPERTR